MAQACQSNCRSGTRAATEIGVHRLGSGRGQGTDGKTITWWRRLWAIAASGALAVWVGAVVATIVGFGVAWLVITLTDLLKQ